MAIQYSATPAPLGGAIVLNFCDPKTGVTALQGTVTLARNGTTIFSGNALDLAIMIDVGDGTDSPLVNGSYIYVITQVYESQTISETIGPIVLGNTVELIPDGLDALFIRLLDGGIQSLSLPSYVASAPRVTNAMPIAGLPPLPFIVVNTDLIQQTDVPIGQQVNNPDSNNLEIIPTYVKRAWRISILARNAQERDYWRDYVLGSFGSIAGIFSTIGQNFNHSFQASNYQVSSDVSGELPGFYGCDVMFTFEGNITIAFKTSLSFIEEITTDIADADGVTIVETQIGPLTL